LSNTTATAVLCRRGGEGAHRRWPRPPRGHAWWPERPRRSLKRAWRGAARRIPASCAPSPRRSSHFRSVCVNAPRVWWTRNTVRPRAISWLIR